MVEAIVDILQGRCLDAQDSSSLTRRIVEQSRSDGVGFLVCDRALWDAAPLELRRLATKQVIQERLGGSWSWLEVDGIQCALHPILGRFVLLPGYETQIGSPEEEPGRYGDEGPCYRIYVEPMFMSAFNVTNRVWDLVDSGRSGSEERQALHPKTSVSWLEVRSWLEKASKVAGVVVSMPWEEEWEGACRAGTTTPYFWGTSSDDADDYCWNSHNSMSVVQAVGLLKPNAWGLYDMVGNTWEWCRDEWLPDYSEKANTAEHFSKIRRVAAQRKFSLRSQSVVIPPNALGAKEVALSSEVLTSILKQNGRDHPLEITTGGLEGVRFVHSESQSTSNALGAKEVALVPGEGLSSIGSAALEVRQGPQPYAKVSGLFQSESAPQSTSNALGAKEMALVCEERVPRGCVAVSKENLDISLHVEATDLSKASIRMCPSELSFTFNSKEAVDGPDHITVFATLRGASVWFGASNYTGAFRSAYRRSWPIGLPVDVSTRMVVRLW